MANSILLIDDERPILSSLTVLFAQHDIFDVDVLQDSRQAFETIDNGDYRVLVLDMSMPEVSGMDVLRHVRECHPHMETIILTGVGDVEMAVEAMKLGAFDYLTKPVSQERLIFTVQRAMERVDMRRELSALRSGLSRANLKHPAVFERILTRSPAMISVLMRLEQIAPTRGTVLILGESGTGKELVAQACHRLSNRAKDPFIAINAGVFAAELFASEFFGHDKGAFTGATETRPGFVEKADGGTLFLDEIGELPLDVQVKLLRVLQEGEFFRVGSTTARRADVRIIAATNKDLNQEIRKGTFRKDLFYRLNINSLKLPPLRQREGDVAHLAHSFLHRHARENGREVSDFTDAALEVLVRYDYPGNVRELENIIESAVILEGTDRLQRSSLPTYLLDAVKKGRRRSDEAEVEQQPGDGAAYRTLDEVEREHVRRVLDAVSGNRTRAAKILGVSRAGLHLKLKRFDLGGV